MARSIARSYVSMTVANLVILVLTAISYIVYSRLLSPIQFAIFGTALASSRVCVMVLDGGIRNVLIADQRDIERSRYTATSVVLFAVSLILIAIGYGVSGLLDTHIPDIGFVLVYVIPFLVSYALFFSSMVKLEKRLRYERIAVVETVSTLFELVLPAVLILAFEMGLAAFIVAAFVSRIVRTLCFWMFSPPAWAMFGTAHIREALTSVRTSLWFQYAILSNAVRDNLPILLVAPLYGTQWAGYYIWALQICAVSSQFAVAAASRIALPVISGHTTDAARYDVSAQQIAWLSKLLGPVLVAVWLVVPMFNVLLFEGKWTPAIALLPWLLLRMMPGIATTILYPLTFVQFGPRWLAVVSSGWTIVELLAAWLALRAFGPVGLAYSYALCVWPGVMLMISKIRGRPDFTIRGVFSAVMLNRPTIAAGLIGVAIMASTAVATTIPHAILLLIATAAIVLLSYMLDAGMRDTVAALLVGGKRAARGRAVPVGEHGVHGRDSLGDMP